MSTTQQHCTSCNKNLDIIEFTIEGEVFKTCKICKERKKGQRTLKNRCEECGIMAIFNYQGENDGIRCKAHIEIGMVNVKSSKCVKCKVKQPAFNFEGESKAIYCAGCSEPGMIDVKSPKCIKCKVKRPNFNFEGESKGIYCAECKEPGMIDVKSQKCIKCKVKIPFFNFEGESKGIYCAECKEPGMIDVKSQKCIKCKVKQQVFNFEGENRGIYCAECKEPGMIDVKSTKCIKCKVKKPNFNFEGESKAIYCAECSEPGMIDVKHPKCIKCKVKRPNFNFEGESKAIYCAGCSEPGMIDVKNSKCDEKDCKSRVSYGYINQIKTKCSRHKLPLMFKKTKVQCSHENCKEISEYGIELPIHCFEHRKDNEFCLLGKKCVQCLRENELCNNEGYCLTYCKPVQITQGIKAYIKKKESLTLAYLDKYVKSDIIPTDDRIIDVSCVKRRPDRLYDCGSYFLVVEIDEKQHKNGYYNGCVFDVKTQEIRRMVQIHEALSLPVIFLRFNPDAFKIKGASQKVNMQKRLDILAKWVSKCLNLGWILGEDESSIRIKHLFYDDYNETDIEFEEITNISELL